MSPLPELHLAQMASSQHGAFTRDQADTAGFSRQSISRRLSSGTWVELRPTVYCHASLPANRMTMLAAACLWAGPEAALSHQTAAAVWELDGRWAESPIHLTVPFNRRLVSPGVEVHRARGFDPTRDARRYRGLRLTSMVRTLVDLSGALEAKWLEVALDSALRRRRVDLGWLRKYLQRLGSRGRPGAPVLLRQIEQRKPKDEGYDSALEVLVSRMLKAHGLPPAIFHYEVGDEDWHLLEADFAFPQYRVVVEADGYRTHSGRRAWANDAATRRRLKANGWDVVSVTWDEVKNDPDGLAEELKAVLVRNGFAPTTPRRRRAAQPPSSSTRRSTS